MEISKAISKYLQERAQIGDDGFFAGKKITDPELVPLQKAMDGLYIPLREMLRSFSKNWKIQMGFGQCSATADQYVALLPPGQKVSNGFYFCICFGHRGEGVVLGAMTSLTQVASPGASPVFRATPKKINSKLTEWQMQPPFCIDVKKWNNLFLLPAEFTYYDIENSPQTIEKNIYDHFAKSANTIEQLTQTNC